MECRCWPKLLVIIILLGFLSGNTICQNIEVPFKSDSIACDTFPPPLWLDGMGSNHIIHLWWQLPLLETTKSHGQTTNYFTPANLIGFNLILNGQFIDYIPYLGGDTVHYWHDIGYWYPSPYNYKTTALYDLDPCGYPGAIEESAYSSLLTIAAGLGYELPFLEYWDWGFSGGEYFWHAGDQWNINEQNGNPYPSAIYTGNTGSTNYIDTLSSTWIDCRRSHCPFAPYIDGDFYLVFDIRLDDNSTSGNEFLRLEITDSISWQSITEYSNAAGSFDWKTKNINITEIAKGENIRISFIAEGENGSNINFWYLDNIKVYRECNPPRDLQWVVFDELMAWRPPLPHTSDKVSTQKELLGYNVYEITQHIGFTADTFFILDPSLGYGPYYATAVYEDCEPASNYIYGPQQIEEIKTDPEINIYPNPADEQITISAHKYISSVKVTDVHGKQLIRSEPKEKQCILDTHGIPNGIYIIQLSIGDIDESRKIIIQH